MKVRTKPDNKGYTVSSIVVRNDGARINVIEKLGLIAAIVIVLITGLWLVFVIF